MRQTAKLLSRSGVILLLAALIGCSDSDSNSPAGPGGGGGGVGAAGSVPNFEIEMNNFTYGRIWASGPNDILLVGTFPIRYDGTTWRLQDIPIDGQVYGVWGSGPNDVYVSGEVGQIAHFTGASWQLVPSPTAETVVSIDGNSSGLVFAVGSNGTILTRVAGNWTSIPSGTSEILRTIDVLESGRAWATGDNATLLTFDSGHWVPDVAPAGAAFIYDFAADNDSNQMILCDNGLFVRDTGTWTKPTSPVPDGEMFRAFAPGNGTYYLRARDDFYMYDSSFSLLTIPGRTQGPSRIGGTRDGLIVATGRFNQNFINNGSGWTKISDGNGDQQFFYFIEGTSPNNMIAGGASPEPFLKDNSGWGPVSTLGTSSQCYDVSIISPDTFVLGWSHSGDVRIYESGVWRDISDTERKIRLYAASTDAIFSTAYTPDESNVRMYNGSSWSNVLTGLNERARSVDGTSATNVFIGAGNGEVAHYNGTSWTVDDLGNQFWHHLFALDSQTVFAADIFGEFAMWDGTDWLLMPPISADSSVRLERIWADDDDNIWVCGDEGLLYNWDGVMWIDHSLPMDANLNGIWGFDDGTLYLATSFGGGIFRYRP